MRKGLSDFHGLKIGVYTCIFYSDMEVRIERRIKLCLLYRKVQIRVRTLRKSAIVVLHIQDPTNFL